MKNSICYFIFLIIPICCITVSCHQSSGLYKKQFTIEEKERLAKQLPDNVVRKFYQGSVAEVMVLREALKFKPKDAILWRELGIPYGKRGMAAEFYEHYEKIIKYDALSWQGWRGYMYLYFYRDYERAIADFDSLDRLTPNFVDHPQATSIHFMRAICYLQLEDYDKALSYWDLHFEEELKTTSEDYIDQKAFLFQGITYYKKGDFVKAQESIDRGLKHIKDNTDLWLWSAKLALHNNERDKALKALGKAQTQFNEGYYNFRYYVEEFYQTYQSDIDDLEKAILNLD